MADAEPEDVLQSALEVTSSVFWIGGAAVAIAAPPVGVALGASAGALHLLGLVRQRFARRSAQVALGAEDRLDQEAPEAAERIQADEGLAAITFKTIEASLHSQHDEQARVLGRVLGDALRSDQPITLDQASLLVDALRSLDLPHLITLRALANEAQPNAEPSWLPTTLKALATGDEASAYGIAAALERSGAIRLDPPTFGGYTVTPFGERIMGYLDGI